MRRLVLLSSLAGLGIALSLASASAQFAYPPAGHVTAAPDDDDDLPTASPGYGNPVESRALPPVSERGGTPYPGAPLPSDGRAAYRTMPPRGEAYMPAPYAPSPPPGYDAPAGYAAAPNYAPPPGYSPPPGYGTSPAPYGAAPIEAPRPPQAIGMPGQVAPGQPMPAQVARGSVAGLPAEDQPEFGAPKQLAPQFRRQVVQYQTKHPAGTIVIDTPSTFLYFVNGDGTAIRYGIGVGRDGFTWAGVEKVTRMAEWPDWHPPAEMIERQPYLPRFMAGGESNPLGARALYLGKTIYRVHGTNQPSTIGSFVSSGCIRMLNEDVMDLYTRVKVGTKVVVLGDGKGPPPGATAAR